MMQMKKLFFLFGAGIVLLVSVIALKGCSKNNSTNVTVEKATKGNIIETVSANGKIQPEVEVKLSPDVSGEIVELPVKEGDVVKKGDLLVRIRPDQYVSNLERMAASLNTSKANLSNSKARLEQVKAQFENIESSFKRSKKLFDQGAISQADFDAAKASYEGAKADISAGEESVKAAEFNVKSSEASLKEANDNLSRTSIYSPVTGTVSKLNVELGERVVGTTQMAGTELMRIANLNEMEVSIDVNENDIIRVKLNDTSLIEVDAYVDRVFKGIVTEIANSANVAVGVSSDQVTNFAVKIRVLQESYKDLLNEKDPSYSPFRPGMSATVDIQTKEAKNIVMVPIQSVTTRMDTLKEEKGKKPEKNKEEELEVTNLKEEKNTKEKKAKPEECVFVFKDGIAKLVKVKTGIQDANNIEIISGVKEGDEIITGPYVVVSRILKDGDEVKKADPEFVFEAKKK